MNAPIDNLRSGLAGLAEEVSTVDLVDRVVESSRRLRLRRFVAGSAVVLAVVGVASGVAVAAQLQTDSLPGPAGSRPPLVESSPPTPEPTVTDTPRPPLTSPPTPPATSPTATPPGPPSTTIPRSAMLQREDVGSGYVVRNDLQPEDHGSLFFVLAYCGYTSETWGAKDDHAVARQSRSITDNDKRYVLQEATRYDEGWAARVMTDLRSALRGTCRIVENGGNPKDVSTFTIVASDFAGDGSLLVKEVRSAPGGVSTQYHVAARQGDVYAHARIHIGGIGEPQARDIGQRMATRLCEATPTC
ncbi:MAG TPA: hypothetical protein VFR67_15230 [Pilimelia sp.]|nr:hypothetical protein [Pilimelia sp.]